jgi:TetR/AcrR family transcriptional repressor of nem operon
VEFHRRGFNACSVEDITKAAGVPKGSFYNHFKSKEALGAEAVDRYTAGSGWRHDPAPGETPLARLRANFEAMRDTQVEFGFTRGCLIGNMGGEVSDHSAVIRAQVESSLGGWSGGIAVAIRAAQARGEVDSGLDASRLGRFILDAWEGALMRAKVVKNGEPFEDFFTVVFESLLR